MSDESGDDWLSDGEEERSLSECWICPFGGESFDTRRKLNDHLSQLYGINSLESLVESVSPESISESDTFYHFCILINYIRSKNQLQGACYQMTLKDLLNKWNISSQSEFWKDEQLLIPIIQNDQLLCGFQADLHHGADDDTLSSTSNQDNPYRASKGQFVVQGELPPSQEFLQEQARRLRELGAFDSFETSNQDSMNISY
eukprot:Protomagalhaensia_sp_Gyna_25__5536@NODE_749_length_2698_cov_129_134637_g587_i0_p2_GENE_NODE_749_length_2698_cov_129_134637_g587_i0NODE_749_length_2698_cov_129_134637_g587_i0_p2_ORF_typecomplete_len201_score30_31DUF629/PF04780_12/0_0065zfC2H2_2/PF12756_7/3_5zfC2H2_2/PF12756_7/2_8_NODE_749_length_2698_cov_129_134637_g587_i0253855